MELQISKAEFENAMPVGASANGAVFDSIQPAIHERTLYIVDNILGTVGMGMLDKDELMTLFVKKYICITAFLSVMRQLDLVLTPSGFGIVSTDKVSPASKQRVDALEGALRTAERKTFAMLVNQLRSKEWGATAQAERCIPYLYGEYEFFFHGVPTLTYQDWTTAVPFIERADEILRKKLSDEQVEVLLTAFRSNDEETAPRQLMNRIHKFTAALFNDGTTKACGQPLRNVMQYVEQHIERYPEYASSNEYQANHYGNFQNRKDSPAYVFG